MVELGCGSATLAILLSKKIKKYVGLDYLNIKHLIKHKCCIICI